MPTKAPPPRTRAARRSLGENIRKAREGASMTQLELAHGCGYKGDDAGAHVSRWESDKQQPRLDNLQKMARVLGVPLDTLLNGK